MTVLTLVSFEDSLSLIPCVTIKHEWRLIQPLLTDISPFQLHFTLLVYMREKTKYKFRKSRCFSKWEKM